VSLIFSGFRCANLATSSRLGRSLLYALTRARDMLMPNRSAKAPSYSTLSAEQMCRISSGSDGIFQSLVTVLVKRLGLTVRREHHRSLSVAQGKGAEFHRDRTASSKAS